MQGLYCLSEQTKHAICQWEKPLENEETIGEESK